MGIVFLQSLHFEFSMINPILLSKTLTYFNSISNIQAGYILDKKTAVFFYRLDFELDI